MHLDETPLFAPLKGLDAGSEAVLDDSELAHLKVFRLEAGDTLELVDGEGGRATARVVQPKRGLLVLESPVSREAARPAAPALAMGILKGSALEETFDHCAQTPLRAFQPLWCDFGQRARGGDAAEGLVRRLRAKARVALKQSRQLWATEILEPTTPEKWLAAHADPVLLLDERGERAPAVPASPWLLCGPEGGFSERELALFEPRATLFSLGPVRLRAKTAPILALGALAAFESGIRDQGLGIRD